MKFLTEDQIEQLKEISNYLLQVRQEKSIRIEEIAAKTHIRLTFLQALDAGEFEKLPEPIYVQGFIRRYAEALGLDGIALANTFTPNIYPEYTNNEPNEPENLDTRRNIQIPFFVPYVLLLAVASIGLVYILSPKFTVKSLEQKQTSVLPDKQKTDPSPVAALSTVAPAAQQQITAALPTPSLTTVAPTTQEQKTAPSPTTLSTTVTPTTQQQKTTPSPTPSSPVATPASTTNSNVTVTLKLQGKSWLQVKVDGKTEFEGELTTGQQKTWTAKKQLKIRSGNAGAVLISTNNQPAQPLGGEGKVKEVTFTPENNR